MPKMSCYASVGMAISPNYYSFPESLGLCSGSQVNCCLLSSGSDYVVNSFRMDISSVLTYPYPAALSGGDPRQEILFSC